MATHSSILAWRMPWTEEPGRLQSMGLQRVRHNSKHAEHSTAQHFNDKANMQCAFQAKRYFEGI